MGTPTSRRRSQVIYTLSMDSPTNAQSRTNYEYTGTQLEHLCQLDVRFPSNRYRKTGIICTIGPACRDVNILTSLIKKGMTVARLNFSHGTHEYHAGTIANIRKANDSLNVGFQSVAIALDTKGPEIRTGILADKSKTEIELKKHSHVQLTTDPAYLECCDSERIFVDYPNIIKVVNAKSRIFIDDGLISVTVDEIGDNFINCTVQNGGMLGSRKGINLPGAIVDFPHVTNKDIEDLKFGVEQGVDLIFASFTRSAKSIQAIREVLGEKGKHIKVIAKIENQEGVLRSDEIIAEADGIMVARGDLGIEIPASKVFLVQKMLIAKCNRAGKPVICATQMLESMVSKPIPTRAESSDVANAVLDGVDCVMLSGETAKGQYPIESLLVMHEICREAESAYYYSKYFEELLRLVPTPTDDATTIAIAATSAVESCRASAVICVTVTGRIAKLLSQWRPPVPIFAVCQNDTIARQLHLWRGVFPLYYEVESNDHNKENDHLRLKSLIDYALTNGRESGAIRKGDLVIVISGATEREGVTNNLRIIKV